MTVLYHSPNSRSSAVAALALELGGDIDIRPVSIPRIDGTGGTDATNPHPEKKVPYIVDGAEEVRERAAIMLYLTDAYPAAGLGPLPGEAGRGAYLSWLSYYQGVMEPIAILDYIGVSHPAVHAAIRDQQTMLATVADALEQGPWLLGERFSAADYLCSSMFMWFPQMTEQHPVIADWTRRCSERPGYAALRELEQRHAP